MIRPQILTLTLPLTVTLTLTLALTLTLTPNSIPQVALRKLRGRQAGRPALRPLENPHPSAPSPTRHEGTDQLVGRAQRQPAGTFSREGACVV